MLTNSLFVTSYILKERIAEHFKGKGIVFDVSNVRVVEKKEKNGKNCLVAFIDVGDVGSYMNGLKLHRSRIDGRQINVRPTVKPEQLEKIVELRKEKIEKAVSSAPKKRSNDDNDNEKTDKRSMKKIKKVKNTPQMLDVLESRDKWSKSKKTRERLKMKKIAQKESAAKSD